MMETDIKRIIYHIYLPLTLILLISAYCNLQFFQDGSSYLLEILQSNSAAIRHGRLSAWLIQMPIVFLAKLLTKLGISTSEHLPILRFVFSLSYSLIPLISLTLSWMVVRKNKEGLLIWVVLIVLFINLINFSWVSELLIGLQLSCPLLLASIVMPEKRMFWIMNAILLPFIFMLHPLIIFLFITLAISSVYISYHNINIRLKIRHFFRFNAIVFLMAGLTRGIIHIYNMTPYEKSFLVLQEGKEYLFITSLENRIFLITAIVIGLVCLLVKQRYQCSYLVYNCTIILAIISALLLVSQYLYQNFPLKTGLSLFISILIMLMATVDSVTEISAFEVKQRFRLVTALSFIFVSVILVKSLIWQTSIHKLLKETALTKQTCTEIMYQDTIISEDFIWLEQNPYTIINNWALPALALIVQDSSPRKLLLEKNSCELYYRSGIVQIDPWSKIPKDLIIPSLGN